MHILLLALSLGAAKPPAGKILVAVMDVEGIDAAGADIARAAPGALTEALDRLGVFKAMTRKDMENMVAFEATKQLVGCQNSASADVNRDGRLDMVVAVELASQLAVIYGR